EGISFDSSQMYRYISREGTTGSFSACPTVRRYIESTRFEDVIPMVGHPPQNDDDYGPRSYGGGGAPGPGDDEVRPVSGPWDLLGGIRGAWGGWGGWQGADGPSGGSWGTPWGAPWGGPGRGGPDGPGSGRRGHGHPGGRRANRGDVRAAVIHLLAEEPMHGYQIIREIEQRSDGAWKPSAGSVYPSLQLLADEGLLTVEEDAGRKTYSLTEA